MSIVIVLLWVLAVPFVGLLGLVFVGMVTRPDPRKTHPETWPAVSVIVPAHEEQDALPATLASLAQQRYPGRVEFVIVDDRSTDSTADIIRSFCTADARFRLHQVKTPGRRLSPKVHAVNSGIAASRGEIILTTDADCTFHPTWIASMVAHFDDDVAMVTGYVESTTPERPGGVVQRFDAVDWFTMMLASRSLSRFGWALASSANNQAYRRDAFEAANGFGASGRAPSGDEDLFVQRIGRLPGARVVFVSEPSARVRTEPIPSLPALLRQRRRWVSRYHHPMHFHPGFFAGIVVLGLHSTALTVAVLALPAFPAAAPWVLGEWAIVWTVQLAGLWIGTGQLDRRDLWGWPVLVWALLHPMFIAFVSVWSLIRPGDWGSGTPGYRRRFFRRRLREMRRKLLASLGIA